MVHSGEPPAGGAGRTAQRTRIHTRSGAPRDTMSFSLRILSTATCIVLLVSNAAAQTEVDEGSFEILVSGRPVGTEQFSIRQSGAGAGSEYVATGTVEVLQPSGRIDLASRLRATGFQADPTTYEVTVRGDAARQIVGSVGNGRFSARIVTPVGEQLREFVASPGATILDEGIAHHYYFLARRTRTGSVPVIIPREYRQVMAEVIDRGEERMTIRGTPATLYRLELRLPGGEARHVWVDTLGRVIRVEVPAQNYVALRTELPR